MSCPRLMWLLSQGLSHLCFAVIVGAVVVGCTSTSSSSANAASSGSASPTATGAGARSEITSGPVTNPLNLPTAIGTDTNSDARGSVSGDPGGLSAPILPVQSSGTGAGGGVSVRASAHYSAYTVPFRVNDSSLNVSYSYDCSSTGGSGFAANMISGSPDNPGSDHKTIADESGTSGSATVRVNPQDTPGNYFLQVDSQCDWKIVVKNG